MTLNAVVNVGRNELVLARTHSNLELLGANSDLRHVEAIAGSVDLMRTNSNGLHTSNTVRLENASLSLSLGQSIGILEPKASFSVGHGLITIIDGLAAEDDTAGRGEDEALHTGGDGGIEQLLRSFYVHGPEQITASFVGGSSHVEYGIDSLDCALQDRKIA